MPLGDITNGNRQVGVTKKDGKRNAIDAAASKAMKSLWALQATKMQQTIAADRLDVSKVVKSLEVKVKTKAKGKGTKKRKSKTTAKGEQKDKAVVKRALEQGKAETKTKRQQRESTLPEPTRTIAEHPRFHFQQRLRPSSETSRRVEEQGARLLRRFREKEDEDKEEEEEEEEVEKEPALVTDKTEPEHSGETETALVSADPHGKVNATATATLTAETTTAGASTWYHSAAMIVMFVLMCALVHYVVSVYTSPAETAEMPTAMSSSVLTQDAISAVPKVTILSPAAGEVVGFDDESSETKVIVQLVGFQWGRRKEGGGREGGEIGSRATTTAHATNPPPPTHQPIPRAEFFPSARASACP